MDSHWWLGFFNFSVAVSAFGSSELVFPLTGWTGEVWATELGLRWPFFKHVYAFLPPLCLGNSHSFSKTQVRNHILSAAS